MHFAIDERHAGMSYRPTAPTSLSAYDYLLPTGQARNLGFARRVALSSLWMSSRVEVFKFDASEN